MALAEQLTRVASQLQLKALRIKCVRAASLACEPRIIHARRFGCCCHCCCCCCYDNQRLCIGCAWLVRAGCHGDAPAVYHLPGCVRQRTQHAWCVGWRGYLARSASTHRHGAGAIVLAKLLRKRVDFAALRCAGCELGTEGVATLLRAARAHAEQRCVPRRAAPPPCPHGLRARHQLGAAGCIEQ